MAKECVLPSVVNEDIKVNMEAQLVKAGVSRMAAGALTGYIIDNNLINSDNDDDRNEIGIATLIGLGLGSKYAKPITKNVIDGFSSVFREFGKTTELEAKKRAAKDILAFGGSVDLDDASEIAIHNNMLNSIKGAGNSAKTVLSKFTNSEFTQSTYSMLRKFGGESGARFNRILQGMNTTINSISSIPKSKFASFVGGDAASYRNFNDTEAPNLIKDLVKDMFPDVEFSESRLKQLWNDSFKRILDSAPVNKDGVWELTEFTPTTQRMYDDVNYGERFKQIDQELIKNEKVGKFIEAHQSFFTDVMNRWISQLDTRILENFSLIKPMAISKRLESGFEVLSRYVASDMGMSEFKEVLNPEEIKAFDMLIKNIEPASDIVQLQKTKHKFTNLDKKYHPQIISTEKISTDFKNFVEKNGYTGLSKEEAEEFYRKDLTDRVIKLNEKDGKLKTYSEKDGDVLSEKFRTKAKAIAKLSNVVSELNRRGSMDEATKLSNSIESFITSRVIQLKDLTPKGKNKTRTIYEIKVPENYGTNPFEFENSHYYRKFIDDLMSGAIVRQSNFLENPRLKYLPHEILESNIETVINKYSMDVGKRIHFAENRLYDNKEVSSFMNNLSEDAKKTHNLSTDAANTIVKRAESAFNYINGIYGKTGDDIKKQIKTQAWSDIIRNSLFMRFGYGFGFYNMFEFAVVTPHISSFSSLKQQVKHYYDNPESLKKAEETLRMLNLVRHQIGSIRPEYENFGTTANQFNQLEATQVYTAKGANYVSDFSLTKKFMNKFFKGSSSDLGLGELAFGSFTSSNAVATTINATAALVEVSKLANIAKQLLDGAQVVKYNDKSFNIGSVKRQLELLGISSDRFEDFVKSSEDFSKIVDDFTQKGEVDFDKIGKMSDVEVDDFNANYYSDMLNVITQATESYHGTNKIMRPESWNTPLGRALSTYSNYPFNFATQHVQRRIKQPMDEWFSKYAEGKNKIFNLEVFEIYSKFKNNDIEGLKKMGLSDEAINEFPIEAYQNVMKHLSTFGISIAGLATLDTIKDVIELPFVEDKDEWARLNRFKVINPNAPKRNQVTWGNIDEDFGLDTFGQVSLYFMGMGARSSLFGTYGNLLENRAKLSRDGIMALTPITDIGNNILKGFLKTVNTDLSDMPIKASKSALNTALEWTPFLGSSILSGPRKAMVNQINNEKKNKFNFFDSETGEFFDSSDIDTNALY